MQGARRQQLVMADRAFGLVNLLEGQGQRPDAAMWNALMECAGFSGQLTRAFGVLQDMTSAGCRPSARTFVALISACNGVWPIARPVSLTPSAACFLMLLYRFSGPGACVHQLDMAPPASIRNHVV